MKVDTGIIKSNTYIGKDVYKMEIQTDLADEVQCGQFVEVEVPNYFLRRPISVCEVKEDHTIVLVYKVVGDGTGALPKQITLAKNLPQFKSDFKELSDYCAESPMRFWKDYYQKQGKKFP